MSIDWTEDVMTSLFDVTEEERVEEHPSVKTCYDLLHKPMNIERCLHRFTEEEHLGKPDERVCLRGRKKREGRAPATRTEIKQDETEIRKNEQREKERKGKQTKENKRTKKNRI